jgi:DNA-binding LacI/PurR family transcriptional regulator
VAIDQAIGRLQASHLAAAGYETIAVVLPTDNRERVFAPPREEGVRQWCSEHGIEVLPTRQIPLRQHTVADTVRELPNGSVGIAAYNDFALALVGAALVQGRSVPADFGVIGIDNSPIAQGSTPTITTVDYDMKFSGHEIVKTLLKEPAMALDAEAVREVERQLNVVQDGSTRSR